MSIELDWSLVTQELADRLCARLNGLLDGAELPSYLGSTHIDALELGTDAPEIQILHIGDVWREFREAAASASRPPPAAAASTPPRPMRLKTYRQYDDEQLMSVHADTESLASETTEYDESTIRWSDTDSDMGQSESMMHSEERNGDSLDALPSLQVHLAVQWLSSSVRLAVTSSLEIHHSGSAVMSLPLSLVLTGFELLAHVVVVLDGTQRCVHLCMSEYGEDGGSDPMPRSFHAPDARMRARHQGRRILPYIAFDSRVGELSKHVLENVGKVERFLGDLIRQVLEDELVFPNFYTVCF